MSHPFVGWSVCQNFLKKFHRIYRSTYGSEYKSGATAKPAESVAAARAAAAARHVVRLAEWWTAASWSPTTSSAAPTSPS